MHRALPIFLLSTAFVTEAHGYGEPDTNGLPNHQERLLHVLTNQIRQAPHDWPGWDTNLATPAARPAVAFEPGLAEAARFHADDMAANNFFAHESFDGTTFSVRAARYFSGPAGENIYMSFGDEDVSRGMTAWMNSTEGHRENMLSFDWTWLGPGFANQSNRTYLVQDFGLSSNVAIPAVPAAAIEPIGSAELRLLANYYTAKRRSPTSMEAVLDGETLTLSRIAGSNGNETYDTRTPMPESCADLYFVATAADGEQTYYPSQGALRAGKTCTEAYVPTRGEKKDPEGPVIIDADDPSGGCHCLQQKPTRGALWSLLLLLLLRRQSPAKY